MKKKVFIKTIVEPVGKSYIKEMNTPKITEIIDITDDSKIVPLKLDDTCSAVIVGKIIILDINIVPTTLIPNTMVIPVKIEIK